MRKELFKGTDIVVKPEFEDWLHIVESIEMSKDIIDIAAQYCSYHAEFEAAQFRCVSTAASIDEITSLLPLSLNVLRKIDFSKIEKIFISDNTDVNLQSSRIDIDELNSLRHGGASALIVEDILNDKIASEVAKNINEQIEKSKDKTLDIGILVSSIQTIAEVSHAPIITAKSRFKVY